MQKVTDEAALILEFEDPLRFAVDDGVTLVPDGIKSAGTRQRTHETELREDGWYVRLRLDGVLESDRFANKRVPGISGARVVRVDQPVIAA